VATSAKGDDAVMLAPENVRVDIPLFHTSEACAGAVTSSLLRRIAFTAGAYAPGIQEHMFFEPNTRSDGGSLSRVEMWFARRLTSLHQMGYRLQSRRITEPTENVLAWVKAGKGYRAAMLPVAYAPLHPGATASEMSFALGVIADVATPQAKADSILALDPWPGVGNPDRFTLTDAHMKILDRAHREQKYFSLIFYWVGWS
jgi:hypothetical protein